MRHIRFICFITLLALIPYGLHVWLWSWADGDINWQGMILVGEGLAGFLFFGLWMVDVGFDLVESWWSSLCNLCSNEWDEWKGEK